MICPYCGGEMDFGNIASSKLISWNPNKRTHTKFFSSDKVVLALGLLTPGYPS